MAKSFNAQKVYEKVKQGKPKYIEETHCPMILKTMYDNGTVSAFCVAASISDTTFYVWVNKYPTFRECYRIGYMYARENWEEEGRLGQEEEFFNMDYWKTIGASRFGIGRTNRIRVELGEKESPYEQYQSLLRQASYGEYTSSEIKQLMESINVGCRVYESFKLQDEVDKMRDDLLKMSQHNGNNIVSIESAKKAN